MSTFIARVTFVALATVAAVSVAAPSTPSQCVKYNNAGSIIEHNLCVRNPTQSPNNAFGVLFHLEQLAVVPVRQADGTVAIQSMLAGDLRPDVVLDEGTMIKVNVVNGLFNRDYKLDFCANARKVGQSCPLAGNVQLNNLMKVPTGQLSAGEYKITADVYLPATETREEMHVSGVQSLVTIE
jgi:hypothetical protein